MSIKKGKILEKKNAIVLIIIIAMVSVLFLYKSPMDVEAFANPVEIETDTGVFAPAEIEDGINKGYFYFYTGDGYDGEWYEKDFSGKGKYDFSDLGQYDGEFKEGLRSGHGVFKWDSGEIYEGEW